MPNLEPILYRLNRGFLGNTLFTWMTAALVFFATYTILRLLRKLLRKRIARFPLAAKLLSETRKFFFAFLSLHFSVLFVQLPPKLEVFLGKMVILSFLFQAALWGSQAIAFYIETNLKKRAAQDAGVATTLGLVSFVSKMLLFTMIALLALNNLGVDITALVAGLGVGGIAIALAVQNVLGDLFASLTIVLDKPFIVGDTIAVGDFSGAIEHIGLKTTRIRSTTGEQLIFSNNDLLQSRIRNFERLNERRIAIPIGVIYETPLDKLKQIPGMLEEIIRPHAKVRFDRAHLVKMADFSINFEVVYWVTERDFETSLNIQQAIFFSIIEKFSKEKIEFAYPTSVQYAHVKRDG